MPLNDNLRESDWKYMQSIKDELLNELCSRINEGAAALATGDEGTPHERYLKLYKYIQEQDDVIAACFNDWRRTTIHWKMVLLRQRDLMRDEHVANLSERARKWLEQAEDLQL